MAGTVGYTVRDTSPSRSRPRSIWVSIFYIPGHTIDSFPEVCAEIRDSGHEIGHHGYLHESPVNLDEQHEREVIEKGLESLQRIGVTPKGYRSPGWDLSANSVGLLLEYGFVYDSSMMGADYQPYWADSRGAGGTVPASRAETRA